MEWILAGRSTTWPYRIGNRMIPTRRSILWAGCPQVGVYRKPIYSISPILSILSNRPLSYRICIYTICRIRYTKPGGLSWTGCDMALSNWRPHDTLPGGISYGSDTYQAEYEMILKPQGTPRAWYPLGGISVDLS